MSGVAKNDLQKEGKPLRNGKPAPTEDDFESVLRPINNHEKSDHCTYVGEL